MPSWRAIHCRTLAEAKVAGKLNQLGIPTFLPRRLVRLHRKGRPLAQRPYFPGYLFADLVADPFIGEIYHLDGVIDVLGTVALPGHVIATLRALADENDVIVHPLRIGATYALNRPGALQDLVVRLERIDNTRRAVVSLRLLGVERPVVVSLEDLDTT